jgi:hypothetical protein
MGCISRVTMNALDARETTDDAPVWSVADRGGRVLAARISLRQLAARREAGLLTEAAWVAHEDDGRWRPIGAALSARSREWYLMREGHAMIGPLATDHVRRGIEAGRVPMDTWVCALGEPRWTRVDEEASFADLFDDTLATVSRGAAKRGRLMLVR